ncbi:MAG: radical SAM protein [Candidatus Lokiarchaeota archaeon]|nr:radical SAM protein [Candidatus Lokiarchaeota archaeon]
MRKSTNYKNIVKISNFLNIPFAPPLTAEIKITERCNLRCKYCDVWKNQSNPHDIPVQQLDKVLNSLRNIGVRILTLTGGDPLLHPQLNDIISLAKKKDFRVHIITKFLTNEKAINLLKIGISCIILSLDTIDPIIYKNLTGKDFNDAKIALTSLLNAKTKYPSKDIAVNCVINKYNIGNLEYFVKYLTKYGNSMFLINLQPYQRNPTILDDILIPNSDLYPIFVEEINKLIEMKEIGYPITDSFTFLRNIPDFLFFNKLSKEIKCKTGYVGVYINNNLEVYPCYQLPVVGNLNEKPLEEIWFSKDFKKQRKNMKKRKCRGCLLLCHTEEGWYDWYDKIDKSFKT